MSRRPPVSPEGPLFIQGASIFQGASSLSRGPPTCSGASYLSRGLLFIQGSFIRLGVSYLCRGLLFVQGSPTCPGASFFLRDSFLLRGPSICPGGLLFVQRASSSVVGRSFGVVPPFWAPGRAITPTYQTPLPTQPSLLKFHTVLELFGYLCISNASNLKHDTSSTKHLIPISQ